ncbi:MAG TPA: 5-(carboxyamino)imidazole ribonucleotide synthase [Bacillota bacterium]|nr:5-(carboxyamino)imidazole ribonucleotide synthase [Bacillota bacterium]
MPKNKEICSILPGKTIGIIGGGQLGRMMALSAKYMGYNIAVLDPTPNCPTAQVADHHIVTSYDDMAGIKELTEMSDVVTYEFENVDLQAATYIEQQRKLPQGAYALKITQDREQEKTLLDQLNVPVAPFHIVTDEKSTEHALNELDYPVVIKTTRGGYDGKGQLKIDSVAQRDEAITFVQENSPCIAEQWITFDREVSVVLTRTLAGEIECFPIAENEHRDHILYKTTVPANISETVEKQALDIAKKIAHGMEVVGTFAIEMFVAGENIYVNEMAPRPHNSGHYTIEACSIDQFAQHVRAICHLPLAPIKLLQNAQMINVLGEHLEPLLTIMPTLGAPYVHLYGKAEAKEKRKMGHVTFVHEQKKDLRQLTTDFEERINQ